MYSFFLSKQQDNKLKKISAMKTTFVNQEILIYIKRRTSLTSLTRRRNDGMTQIIFLKNFWRCDGKKSKQKKKVPSPRSHLPQQQGTPYTRYMYAPCWRLSFPRYTRRKNTTWMCATHTHTTVVHTSHLYLFKKIAKGVELFDKIFFWRYYRCTFTDVHPNLRDLSWQPLHYAPQLHPARQRQLRASPSTYPCQT